MELIFGRPWLRAGARSSRRAIRSKSSFVPHSGFSATIPDARQIKDDLFDYGTFEIGKPTGIDIREKKMTLPLIHALSKSSRGEVNRIKRLVKKSEDKPKAVHEVIDFVKSSGGIDYAITVMERYHQEAKDILSTFPASDYRTSLEQLVQFTIERTK